MSDHNVKTVIADPIVNRIIEHHRKMIGDKTSSGTAARIIQAFHNAGMTLLPDRQIQQPKGQHVDLSA